MCGTFFLCPNVINYKLIVLSLIIIKKDVFLQRIWWNGIVQRRARYVVKTKHVDSISEYRL